VVRKTGDVWSSRDSSILERHAPSEIVRTVKSLTAQKTWERHESFLQEYLWGGGFWERSYYIGTAGTVSTETIER
jgi:Transposase and inactivated derivatives